MFWLTYTKGFSTIQIIKPENHKIKYSTFVDWKAFKKLDIEFFKNAIFAAHF